MGLLVTVVTTYQRYHRALDRAEQRFEQQAEQARATVESELTTYIDRLQDIGTYVIVDDRPTAEEFERFIAGSAILDELEPLTGIIVLERVAEGDLELFTSELRAADPDFLVIELAQLPPGTPRYLITYFVDGGLDIALPPGLDVTPISSMSSELETGEVAAGAVQNDPFVRELTDRFDATVVEEVLGSLDFIIAVPVFGPGVDPSTGGTPLAWVAASVGEFDGVLERPFAGTGGSIGADLTVHIEDARPAAEGVSRVADSPSPPGPIEAATFTRTDRFEVAGLELSLRTWSAPDADAEARELLVYTLIVGLIASVLGAAVVYLRGRSLTRERWLAALRDETERAQLRRDILASVAEAVVVLDGDGRIITGNPAWDRLRGSDPRGTDEPTVDQGRSYVDVAREMSPTAGDAIAHAVASVLEGETEAGGADVPIDAGDATIWKSMTVTRMHGGSGGAVVVHHDITQRKQSEATWVRRASQDPLTGLLNRAAFEDEARSAVAEARNSGSPIGALFIDLDDFKLINDTYDHSVGDAVLKAVARRIANAVRATDAVARQGGDEFVVLLRDLPDPLTADRTAERILESLREPITIDDRELIVGASIGVVVLARRSELSVATLLALADRAMYEAKDRGGSTFVKVG